MILNKLKLYMDFIVIKHTVFAIPFAYLGAFLASKGIPSVHVLLWVGLAFIGARSGAMAINNLIDKEIDLKNPRTKNRALPSGLIKVKEVIFLIIVSYFMLFYSAYKLNYTCLLLAPLVPITSFIYPYLKRFTYLSHLVLGLNLGYAPAGGWIAVTDSIDPIIFILTAAVTLWVAGFDIIYSLQDIDIDLAMNLKSIPSVFGIENALKISKTFHILMLALLFAFFMAMKLGIVFLFGLFIISILVMYEHKIVARKTYKDIQIAFFNVNAMISMSMFIFTVLDVVFLGVRC